MNGNDSVISVVAVDTFDYLFMLGSGVQCLELQRAFPLLRWSHV